MSKTSSANKKTGQQSSVGSTPPTTSNSASMDSGRRKPSTRSKPHGKGLLHRKSTKRAESASALPEKGTGPSTKKTSGTKGNEKQADNQIQQQQEHQQEQQRENFPAKSIIPDPLTELPAWYSSDTDWAATSAAQFRAKYPVHNAFGPRYYRNHHLLPPRETRPPSIFSPAFPPMAASDRTQDSSKGSGPSRTPSGSPLPTPNSSQVRLQDGKGRARKLSQTAQDSVDVLEGMDPWGTTWHNRSPYDIGERVSPEFEHSPIVSIPVPARSRRASLTPPIRHKTTVPSPLSQSTSAVHLASEPLSSHLPRRLSKSRKSFRGLFGSNSDPTHRGSRSAPVIAADYSNSLGRKVSRTRSLIPPSISSSSASLAPTEIKVKRGSILGRLARRFSVMRKSNTSPSLHDSVRSARQSLSADTHAASHQAPSQPQRPPLEEKSSEGSKRIPPPLAEAQGVHTIDDPLRHENSDAQSVVSEDPPFSAGKLHVANPDEVVHSPMQVISPLPQLPDHRVEYESFERTQAAPDVPLRMESSEYDRVPYTALSVISEGETYMSTPQSKPMTAFDASPVSPPTIPSILSQPANTPMEPPDVLVPPSSPPLPELPPPTPVSKGEPSLPPTPSTTVTSLHTHSATPTLTVKDISLPPTSPTLQGAYHAQRADTSSSLPEEERDILPPEMYSPLTRRVPYTDIDPLARASMIVNPPTPFTPSLVIPPPTATTASPASAHTDGSKTSPRSTSPKKDSSQRTRARHTETFKLVRSNSGDTPTIGRGFVVEGEHWEVVESPVERSPTKKSKRAERAEVKKRESGSDDSDAQRKQSIHRKSSSANDRRASDTEPSQRITRAHSTDGPHRRSSSKARHSVEGSRSTQTPVIYAPKAAAIYPLAAPAGHAGAGVERRTSTSASTRPSSEFQPTADMNTLKARDAWEMERLWKGRSAIYGAEGVSAPMPRHISSDSRPSTVMSADLHRASTIPSVGDSTSTVSPGHGSNHTYFVVQTPQQGVHHIPAHSQYSPPPPPAIYTTTTAVQEQVSPSPDHFQQSMLSRSFPDNVPFPSITKVPDLPPPRANPLPELPRMSTYKPPPLPPSIANIGSGTPA